MPRLAASALILAMVAGFSLVTSKLKQILLLLMFALPLRAAEPVSVCATFGMDANGDLSTAWSISVVQQDRSGFVEMGDGSTLRDEAWLVYEFNSHPGDDALSTTLFLGSKAIKMPKALADVFFLNLTLNNTQP